jgi:hypothetical protein
LHRRDGVNHERVAAEGEPRPFINDLLAAEIRIPRKPSETVEIRHGQRTAHPVCVHANVGHAHEAAGRATENPALDQILHRRGMRVDAHVEVQHLFPHRHQKTEMPLLARVFLCNLQFDRFVRATQSGKKWRNRFAHLEINGPVLDLDHHVVVECAV